MGGIAVTGHSYTALSSLAGGKSVSNKCRFEPRLGRARNLFGLELIFTDFSLAL